MNMKTAAEILQLEDISVSTIQSLINGRDKNQTPSHCGIPELTPILTQQLLDMAIYQATTDKSFVLLNYTHTPRPKHWCKGANEMEAYCSCKMSAALAAYKYEVALYAKTL